MRPDLAAATHKFLERVTLTGAEAQTMVMCMTAMAALANPQLQKPPVIQDDAVSSKSVINGKEEAKPKVEANPIPKGKNKPKSQKSA